MARLEVPILVELDEIREYLEQNDIVEVVRCKDCIYYERKGYRQGCGQCQWSFAVVEDDDYCSYGESAQGERKNNGRLRKDK